MISHASYLLAWIISIEFDQSMDGKLETASSLPTARFHKSSFSSRGIFNRCVEVSVTEFSVLVRHSEEHERVLKFSIPEWEAFIAGVKNNEFEVSST
jgi:hypothetical protein